MGRLCGLNGGSSAFKILTGKATENRPLGRPWRRWEHHIRMDIKEIGCINRFTSLRKNLFNLLEFFFSEVNLVIQHIIVQDQDAQNNNKKYV